MANGDYGTQFCLLLHSVKPLLSYINPVRALVSVRGYLGMATFKFLHVICTIITVYFFHWNNIIWHGQNTENTRSGCYLDFIRLYLRFGKT